MTDHKPKPEETPAKVKPPMPEDSKPEAPREIGGQPGPEPTRYGDWEKAGLISDF